jgi:hypothetical protein
VFDINIKHGALRTNKDKDNGKVQGVTVSKLKVRFGFAVACFLLA